MGVLGGLLSNLAQVCFLCEITTHSGTAQSQNHFSTALLAKQCVCVILSELGDWNT